MEPNDLSQLLDEILGRGGERRGVECKGPGTPRDKALMTKVIRAMMSMANRRDGGIVIIGVDDSSGILTPTGLTFAQRDSWKHDHIADKSTAYADPPIEFTIVPFLRANCDFVGIVVSEFIDIPVLCRKDYSEDGKPILREGACYVRTRRKPESADVPTQTDMRDLLDLATAKRLRAFVSLAERSGTVILPAERMLSSTNDANEFRRQIEDFL